MTIVVTGGTGNFGALTINALLDRGLDPSMIVAAGRNIERLAELETLGIRVAHIDFENLSSLRAAFEGANRVLLVAAPGNPHRMIQHVNVIRAAENSDVDLLVYTSWLRATTSTMLVAADHRMTEFTLAKAGVPYAVLRCAGYFESRTAMIPFWRARGEVLGAAANGRVHSASRVDLAEAAAVVLTTTDHQGAIYELASDNPYSLSELAAEIGRQSGHHVHYVDLSTAEFETRLVEAGFGRSQAAAFADYDRAIARGECEISTNDLRRLLNRPLTEMPDAIRNALTTW